MPCWRWLHLPSTFHLVWSRHLYRQVRYLSNFEIWPTFSILTSRFLQDKAIAATGHPEFYSCGGLCTHHSLPCFSPSNQTLGCQAGYWLCQDQLQCIQQSLHVRGTFFYNLCDGQTNCKDGSDETVYQCLQVGAIGRYLLLRPCDCAGIFLWSYPQYSPAGGGVAFPPSLTLLLQRPFGIHGRACVLQTGGCAGQELSQEWGRNHTNYICILSFFFGFLARLLCNICFLSMAFHLIYFKKHFMLISDCSTSP